MQLFKQKTKLTREEHTIGKMVHYLRSRATTVFVFTSKKRVLTQYTDLFIHKQIIYFAREEFRHNIM